MKKVFAFLLLSVFIIGLLYLLFTIIYIVGCNKKYMPDNYVGDPDLLNMEVLILFINSFLLWLTSLTIFFNCTQRIRNSFSLSLLSFFLLPALYSLRFVYTYNDFIYPKIVCAGLIGIFFILQVICFFVFRKLNGKGYFG